LNGRPPFAPPRSHSNWPKGASGHLSFVKTAYGSVDSGIFADSSCQVGRHWSGAVQVTVKSAPPGFKLLQCGERRRVRT
jgi:hypothetical protein